MKNTIQILSLVVLLSTLSTAAMAATPTYFTNRAAFEMAVDPRVVDDYSNAGYVTIQDNATMSAVLGETDYVSTGFSNWNIISNGGYCAGCNGSYRLSFQTTSMGTGVGIFGVGLDIRANSSSVPYFAFITFGDGTTADIALPVNTSFFSVTAPELIQSIHFGLSGGGTTTSGSFLIDNLTIGAQAPCGNSVLDTGEQCDDGNFTEGDGCSSTCQIEYCGNGVLDPNEVCDDSNASHGDGCSASCLSDESCGNGILDGPVGEQCDDGDTTSGDGCSAGCQLEFCGNGEVDPDEFCDDGNRVDNDGCSADCQSDESCGNGIVDSAVGEACDDGNNIDGDGCQADCALPWCGDGVLDSGEICDDNTNIDGDGCNATCTSDETCGNGIVDGVMDEQCDDGGTEDGDGCSAACILEFCGNGVIDPMEVCDDDNESSGDGCSADCRSDESCGNGLVDAAAGEACDDDNDLSGDGCSATCQLEYCGNGTVDTAELCDDGNNIAGDGCSADCQSDESCGNGILDAAVGEACDDGNDVDGDGCQADCALADCGDGVLDDGEACDDGNNLDADDCNATCTSDESCGNSIIDLTVGEACDDGNDVAGDGCSATCQLEYCGNGTVDEAELCDDGNNLSGDGCSPDCLSDESCGNGILDAAVGEACDDGNDVDGDGCQADCALADCGDGTLDDDETCDDGNNLDADGCNATCTSDESCGNGILDAAAGEACDDGNDLAGDGCSDTCQLEYCGNGTVDEAELCDDGNNLSGDGCSPDCLSDESCGNGILDAHMGEACDDGNEIDGDGCQANCALPNCGDGILDDGEVCDDGNNLSADGCNTTCTSDETCGNGILDVPTDEACDDGEDNNDETGPCTTTCTIWGQEQTNPSDEGCGCAASGQHKSTSALPLLLFGLLLLRRRRKAA